MKRICALALFGTLLSNIAGVSAANACRLPSQAQSVFHDAPPTTYASNGATVLRIELSDGDSLGEEGSGHVVANIVEAPDKTLIGKKIRVEGGIWSGCTGWGSQKSTVYVAGRFKRSEDGGEIFVAEAYGDNE